MNVRTERGLGLGLVTPFVEHMGREGPAQGHVLSEESSVSP